ncbi:urease subunit alpha [Herbaspirillum rhizosphaerae]|uniref:urease subunit alpha n=1 Tax=Herbaspirillum rhizosphaerae TaxID=346179 RepID=UPI00067C7893|nr:urease subunit alpha [Herbaspirillum rhizosphaerae]
MTKITRDKYRNMFGPTTGDRFRLGDTNLWAQIERDFTTYGEELTFGMGKAIRDGMGQSQLSQAQGACDTVIINAVVIDHTGVFKADIGITGGNISGIGKAGNPDMQPGVSLIVGPGTQIIDASGKVVTAGTVASNVPISSPNILGAMSASGVTTVIGGGSGPLTATRVTSSTPGAWAGLRLLDSLDAWPLNFLVLGVGNVSQPAALIEQITNGIAAGFVVHDNRGSTPAAIDACLSVADDYGLPVVIASDTLNESAYVDDTIAAFKGRTVIAVDIDGVEGGHSPDVVKLAGLPNCLPTTSIAAHPHTKDTIDGLLDAVVRANNLDKAIPEDVAVAESMVLRDVITAADILHDLGAISIFSATSVVPEANATMATRVWQTAHKMKAQRGALPGDNPQSDNARIRRYIAKYTINPAIAYGVSRQVGSVEVGKLADLVLWDRARFGVAPELVIKGGVAVVDRDSAILSTDQSLIFTAGENRLPSDAFRHRPTSIEVNRVRGLRKADMVHNGTTPRIAVDPETFQVMAEGELLTGGPADLVPLAQLYTL